MNENLQDELYLLENKQAKGAKLCAKLEGKKCPKTFFEVLEQNLNYILMIIN